MYIKGERKMKKTAVLVLLIVVILTLTAGECSTAPPPTQHQSNWTNCGAMPLGSAPGGVGPPPVGQAWSRSPDCRGPFWVEK
jgi:hypothetical protein